MMGDKMTLRQLRMIIRTVKAVYGYVVTGEDGHYFKLVKKDLLEVLKGLDDSETIQAVYNFEQDAIYIN